MLPSTYAWLAKSLAENEDQPAMVAEAARLFGTHEGDGKTNSPVIMGWVSEIAAIPGEEAVAAFLNDHVQAWCGLFMAHCAHVAAFEIPLQPLWALNWQHFGVRSLEPSLGDVLVFERRDGAGKLIGGHVGLYVSESAAAFNVLGGNEGDSAAIVAIAKARLHSCQRPIYPQGHPANMKACRAAADGTLSTNEA